MWLILLFDAWLNIYRPSHLSRSQWPYRKYNTLSHLHAHKSINLAAMAFRNACPLSMHRQIWAISCICIFLIPNDNEMKVRYILVVLCFSFLATITTIFYLREKLEWKGWHLAFNLYWLDFRLKSDHVSKNSFSNQRSVALHIFAWFTVNINNFVYQIEIWNTKI